MSVWRSVLLSSVPMILYIVGAVVVIASCGDGFGVCMDRIVGER